MVVLRVLNLSATALAAQALGLTKGVTLHIPRMYRVILGSRQLC